MKTPGERIRYYRNLNGWSQEELADKLNISLPAYSKIERNVTDINFSRLIQLAKVLKVNVIDLIPGSNKPSDKNDLEKILAEKESEIIKLQKKIIELLEGKSKNK